MATQLPASDNRFSPPMGAQAYYSVLGCEGGYRTYFDYEVAMKAARITEEAGKRVEIVQTDLRPSHKGIQWTVYKSAEV